ncbi:2-methoxy-6-polyprenyl-1,4-benzoquinol methylase, mitochondrial isoform X2 [Heterodontus francisci]|uniref:2-methoxy-6-polyprenyl-1,4-benzoquinol methylase, mitochondrial isoform X2 n=1 Tax=Heterodontus francisci TaxID=7792 RepID=UPI00355B4C10
MLEMLSRSGSICGERNRVNVSVYKVFKNVAKNYDIMNDAMSLGIHRLWKDALLHTMNPLPGTKLLDVAGGTGDIAFRFLDYVRSQHERQNRRAMKSYQSPSWQQISDFYEQQNKFDSDSGSKAVICDINKEMLKVGRQKAEQLNYTEGLSWVVGNAEELPFDDDKFDVYTIAFGIRNVTHIDHVLQEAYRVLKPGGRFLCLEFSKVQNPIISSGFVQLSGLQGHCRGQLRVNRIAVSLELHVGQTGLYHLYSFQVIPVLGEVIAADWKSYQYLVESIQRFPDQEEFKAMIEDAGFYKVEYNNLTSGIVAVHSGFKL